MFCAHCAHVEGHQFQCDRAGWTSTWWILSSFWTDLENIMFGGLHRSIRTLFVSLHPPKDPLFIVWRQLDPLASFCWVDYNHFDGDLLGVHLGGHYCASKIKLPTCTNWLLIQFGRQTRKGWLFSDKKHDYKVWLTSHRGNTPPTHSL